MSEQVKKLVARLRFPEFEGTKEWPLTSVGSYIEEYRKNSTSQDEFEVLTSARDGLIRQRDYFDNDRITERDNIGFNVIPPNFLTYRSRSDDRRFYFNENLLGITGIISTYYPVFNIQNGVNKFFIELLSKYSEHVGKHSVGTSQTVLSLNVLKKIELPIPSPNEQQKIADCLSSLDGLITAQNQKVEALKQQKKGLMQQLFPAEGETFPKLRFPEFENGPEWRFLNGDKIFEPITNKKHNSDLPILAITQEHGAIPRELIDYKVIATEQSIESYKVVEVGDFIISLRSFQGGIEYSNYKGICSPAYIILRNKIKVFDLFFKYYFKTDLFIRDLNKNIEGIRDGKMVSFSQFSERLLPLPDYDEQVKIANCLFSIDDSISIETNKLDALKKHKNGLMQQLFPSLDEA